MFENLDGLNKKKVNFTCFFFFSFSYKSEDGILNIVFNFCVYLSEDIGNIQGTILLILAVN